MGGGINKSTVSRPASIALGPWGGKGGKVWDDGTHNSIKKIIIKHGCCVDSIHVVYDNGGETFTGVKHGCDGGAVKKAVTLGEDEYINGVSGSFGKFNDSKVITSLSFQTNKRNLGQFGQEGGTCFSLPIDGGHVVGFFGRSEQFLDSIGVRVSPIQSVAPIVHIQNVENFNVFAN